MEFGNPIVGSEVLIRQSIQSPDYIQGVSGWRLGRDGNVEINNLIARGTLQSDNYDPGIAGWILNQDGTAELNDVTARGAITASEVDVPVPGSIEAHTRIESTTGVINPNAPRVYFTHEGETDYDTPAEIVSSWTGLDGETARGRLALKPAQSSISNEFPVVQLTGQSVDGLTPVNVAITNVGAQVGAKLEISGLHIEAEKMRPTFASNTTAQITNSTVPIGTQAVPAVSQVAATIEPAPSGIVKVEIYGALSNNTAGAGTRLGFEIRENNSAGASLRGATTSLCLEHNGTTLERLGAVFYWDGLPTDVNWFVRLMYWVTAGNGIYTIRRLTVTPVF